MQCFPFTCLCNKKIRARKATLILLLLSDSSRILYHNVFWGFFISEKRTGTIFSFGWQPYFIYYVACGKLGYRKVHMQLQQKLTEMRRNDVALHWKPQSRSETCHSSSGPSIHGQDGTPRPSHVTSKINGVRASI